MPQAAPYGEAPAPGWFASAVSGYLSLSREGLAYIGEGAAEVWRRAGELLDQTTDQVVDGFASAGSGYLSLSREGLAYIGEGAAEVWRRAGDALPSLPVLLTSGAILVGVVLGVTFVVLRVVLKVL